MLAEGTAGQRKPERTPSASGRGQEGRWLSRRTLAWASYDVASSTYLGVVPIVLFPIYFRTVLAPGEAGAFYWGLTVAVALVVAGLSAPFLGMFADRTGRRWPLLAAATLACCLAIASLSLIGPNTGLALALAFVVAHAGYLIATSLYESYLPHIARPSQSGRISSFGWAIGFLGGVLAILAVLPLAGAGTGPDNLDRYRMSFLVVAAMFALLAVPALWGLRRIVERPQQRQPQANPLSIRRTLASWRDQREVVKVLLAFYLINDGMVTISVFAANYFRTRFGTSVEQLLILLLAYHAVALPATLTFGVLADRWTHRKAIALTLSIWVAALTLMAFGNGAWVPAVAVALLGLVYGSTNAMMRSLLSHMVPAERAAEFFGFNTLAGRLSAAAGPLLFGLIVTATGSQRVALGSVLLFIGAGAAVLAAVKVPEFGRGGPPSELID